MRWRTVLHCFPPCALVGLGEACVIPAAYSLVVDHFPPGRRQGDRLGDDRHGGGRQRFVSGWAAAAYLRSDRRLGMTPADAATLFGTLTLIIQIFFALCGGHIALHPLPVAVAGHIGPDHHAGGSGGLHDDRLCRRAGRFPRAHIGALWPAGAVGRNRVRAAAGRIHVGPCPGRQGNAALGGDPVDHACLDHGDLAAIHVLESSLNYGKGKFADTLEVLQSVSYQGRTREHVQPAVRVHPRSRRRALCINARFSRRIIGLSEQESADVIRLFCSVATLPDYQIRHCWTPDVAAMWDNGFTRHYATVDYSAPARMQRMTMTGGPVLGGRTGRPNRRLPERQIRASARSNRRMADVCNVSPVLRSAMPAQARAWLPSRMIPSL